MKDGLTVVFRDEKLTLYKAGGATFLYRREHKGETAAERVFSSDGGQAQLAVYPIRPLQTPQPLARHIMITLTPPLSLPPQSKTTQTLTMPVEIGVFATTGSSSSHLMDSFSPSPPKYALYGPPETGYICRYHKSTVTPTGGAAEYEAIAITRFENNLQDWITVNKIVLDAYMVDLYLKDDTPYLEDASMIIESENTAHIYLHNKPPLPNLKDIPLVSETVKKFRLSIFERPTLGAEKFVMEHGY